MRFFIAVLFVSCFSVHQAGAQSFFDWVDRFLGDEEVDSLEQKPFQFFGLPFVFYSPETSLAFGPALFSVYKIRDDGVTNASNSRLYGYYSLNNQWFARLDGSFWGRKNKWRLQYDLNFSINPYRFYGIGNDTPDDPEKYSQYRWRVLLTPYLNLSQEKNIWLGLRGEFLRYTNLEFEPGGRFELNNVLGEEGGNVLGAGVRVVWDTRDQPYYPLGGTYLEAGWTWYDEVIGSDYVYQQWLLEGRKFWNTWDEQVIAAQVMLRVGQGDVPFQEMAEIGHESRFRGIVGGRYLDKVGYTAQVEYRLPIWWRFGVNGFASIGRLGERLDDLLTVDGIHTAIGAGLRFVVNRGEKLSLRFDVAYSPSERGTAYYFTLREAF